MGNLELLGRAMEAQGKAVTLMEEWLRLEQDDEQQPDPAPKPAYKLEAGATVREKNNEFSPEWTVVCVLDTCCQKLVFCSDGEKRAAHNLTVTHPATPEVGDFVMREGDGYLEVVSRAHASGQIRLRDGDVWERSEFKIIAKAPKRHLQTSSEDS